MPDLRFEEIKEEYLLDVLEIYNYYVLDTTATWHTNALTIDEFRKIVFFKDNKYRTFVMIENDSIIGYVLITPFKKREAWGKTAEVSIYLRKNCTGKGIGKRALEYIELFSKKNDIHVLIASISGDNDSSIKLFEKCGYEKCAHYREVGYKFGKWLDAVAYQKIIS